MLVVGEAQYSLRVRRDIRGEDGVIHALVVAVTGCLALAVTTTADRATSATRQRERHLVSIAGNPALLGDFRTRIPKGRDVHHSERAVLEWREEVQFNRFEVTR